MLKCIAFKQNTKIIETLSTFLAVFCLNVLRLGLRTLSKDYLFIWIFM